MEGSGNIILRLWYGGGKGNVLVIVAVVEYLSGVIVDEESIIGEERKGLGLFLHKRVVESGIAYTFGKEICFEIGFCRFG